MSIKMFPSRDTVYDILNNQNNCEQQLLDFYNAYIMAVSCLSVYTDAGDYKKYYIEELENEIKNRIIIKLPVLRIAVKRKGKQNYGNYNGFVLAQRGSPVFIRYVTDGRQSEESCRQ